MRPLDVAHDLAARFHAAGLPSAGVDARLLLCHVMGMDQRELMLADLVTRPERAQLEQLAVRRLAGEPVQHLTGVAHFRNETLQVGPGVFIPRPETELLVDAVLAALVGAEGRRVVELCAGSGAITLALAREMGGLELHAVELSREAWPWLVRNLEGVGAHLVQADMSEALHHLDGTVDVVVANPPYVPESHRHQLPGDVAGRDPDVALFGGDDGLDALRVVCEVAGRLLRPGGCLVTEHDESHQEAVLRLCRPPVFAHAAGHLDLAGRPRFVTARRSDVAGWTP